uniref:Acyl-ACP thioesterase-like C-terminal domain-containing protein n=2 Tax=Biomphalaria glabrata TaxID=6526 RepID=A0A2C9L6B3_BIOGL
MSTGRTHLWALWKRLYLQHWAVTNISVTDTPQCCLRFTIPGLSTDCFDGDGNPNIDSIMKISGISRVYFFDQPLDDSGKRFLDFNVILKDRLLFMVSTHFRMSKLLYNPDIPKWPINGQYSLSNVGNSSLIDQISFYSPDITSEPLWTQRCQLVSVNNDTRLPSALPDWFQDKYKGKGGMDKGLAVMPIQRPLNTYSYPITVQWLDTDGFRHTNFSSYVNWVLNAIYSSLSKQELEPAQGSSSSAFLPGVTRAALSRGVKDLKIRYISESLENQNLNVYVWQEESQTNTFFASVERENLQVCQLQLEYFD